MASLQAHMQAITDHMQVKGKVNTIMLDACKKVGVVFEAVVASFEAVNCAGLQVQCTGACPLVNLDKTDGCQARPLVTCRLCCNAQLLVCGSILQTCRW